MSDDVLLRSFFNYLDHNESQVLQACLARKEVLDQDKDTISLFTRLNSTTIPTSNNLEHITKNVAKYVLLHQPYFALHNIRCGMLASHPSLWQ